MLVVSVCGVKAWGVKGVIRHTSIGLQLLMGKFNKPYYRKDLAHNHTPDSFCSRDQVDNNCSFGEALLELGTPHCDGITH